MKGLGEKKKTLIDTDNNMVIARGKGVGEVEEDKVGINGGGRRLEFGW